MLNAFHLEDDNADANATNNFPKCLIRKRVGPFCPKAGSDKTNKPQAKATKIDMATTITTTAMMAKALRILCMSRGDNGCKNVCSSCQCR